MQFKRSVVGKRFEAAWYLSLLKIQCLVELLSIMCGSTRTALIFSSTYDIHQISAPNELTSTLYCYAGSEEGNAKNSEVSLNAGDWEVVASGRQ